MRAVRARQREKKLAKIDRKALETESSGKLKISLCVNAILVVCVVAMFAMTLTSDSPTIVDYQSKLLNRYASWEQELTEREKAVSEKEQDLGSRWIQNRQISQISHKIVIFLTENRRNRRTIWRD